MIFHLDLVSSLNEDTRDQDQPSFRYILSSGRSRDSTYDGPDRPFHRLKKTRSFVPLFFPPLLLLFLSFSLSLSPTPFLVLSDYFALRRSIKSRCIVKVSRFSRACNEAVLSLPYIERFDLKAIALRRYATSRISSRVVHVLLCMSKVYAHLSSFHIQYK